MSDQFTTHTGSSGPLIQCFNIDVVYLFNRVGLYCILALQIHRPGSSISSRARDAPRLDFRPFHGLLGKRTWLTLLAYLNLVLRDASEDVSREELHEIEQFRYLQSFDKLQKWSIEEGMNAQATGPALRHTQPNILFGLKDHKA